MNTEPAYTFGPARTTLPRITATDQALLALLDEHKVLTADQIARAMFGSTAAAVRRLNRLRRHGLLDSHRRPDRAHRALDTTWTLGRVGLALHAEALGHPGARPSPRAQLRRLAELAQQHRARQQAADDVFVDLLAHARTHPATALQRWLSPDTVAQHLFAIRVDGHAVWREHDRAVAFFLLLDTGTAPLPGLVDRVVAHDRLEDWNCPADPVLVSLPNPMREARLRSALTGRLTRVTVATTVRPTPDPAEAVWAVVGDDITRRRPLSALPT